ncbi:low molecular weight protein-tyrosine-phosphatase [soil metagenome]
MRILMVCLGNICRSPLAEGILKHKAKKAALDWTIDSAGTAHQLTGAAPHKLSQKVAAMNGIDIGYQQCRQFVKEDILNFDRIYVMDSENYNDVKKISGNLWNENTVELIMNELHPGKNINIPDPWFGTEEGYHKVYKMISDACDAIIEKYSAPTLKGLRQY